MYDVILFENSWESSNHLLDLKIIAQMLQSQGLKVAILNIYGEYTPEYFEDIKILDISTTHICPRRPNPYFVHALSFLRKQNLFFREVLAQIRDMANVFYFGSYNYYISTELLKFDKPFFLWGLRSFTFEIKWRKFIRDPFILQKLYFKNLMIKNPNAHFFVSNEIIKREFEQRGMPAEKMVLRPERLSTGQESQRYDLLSKKNRFLTIGWIRDCKRVEMTISAFKQIQTNQNELYIVGRSNDDYEAFLKSRYINNHNILRIRERLSDHDFNNHFAMAHFVCFADFSDPKNTITNGTFIEALLHYRPVIAPNYEPFASIINKYHVGILYDPKDLNSYINAMREIQERGTQSFEESISEFLKTINYNNAAKKLKEEISIILKMNNNVTD